MKPASKSSSAGRLRRLRPDDVGGGKTESKDQQPASEATNKRHKGVETRSATAKKCTGTTEKHISVATGVVLKRKLSPTEDHAEHVRHKVGTGANHMNTSQKVGHRGGAIQDSVASPSADALASDEVDAAFCHKCEQTTDYDDDRLYLCDAIDTSNKTRYCNNAVHYSCGDFTRPPLSWFCTRCTDALQSRFRQMHDHMASSTDMSRNQTLKMFASALDMGTTTLRKLLGKWEADGCKALPPSTAGVRNRILQGGDAIAKVCNLFSSHAKDDVGEDTASGQDDVGEDTASGQDDMGLQCSLQNSARSFVI